MTTDVEFAEDAVLGIILNHPDAAAEVFAQVPTEAFTGHRALIAQAIHGLRLKREHIDMTTVSAELMKRGMLSRVGPDTVAKLAGGYSVRAALPSYLDEVVRALRLRKVEAIGIRAAQLSGANDADPLTIAQAIHAQSQAIIDAYEADADVTTMTLDEFLAVEEEEYDWVIPGLLERSDRLILTGGEGLGKALAVDTPILTSAGWSDMGSLKVGDEVFGPDGRPVRVTAATDVMLDRPCYRLTFSDGSTIVADEQHLWRTETLKSRESTSKAARRGETKSRGTDQRHKRQHFPAVVTTGHIAETVTVRGNVTNHSIDVCDPIRWPEADLPIAPYVLGAWLGDGTSLGSGFTCADPEIIEHIAQHEPIRKLDNRYRYSISDGHKGSRASLTTRLRALGVLGNKHIPTAYLRASIEQRIELLRGLMDTDGSVTATKNSHVCEFTSTSEGLATGVRELALGLGINASIRQGVAKINGRVIGPKWRVTFTTPIRVFNLTRKSDRQVPSTTTRARKRYIVSVERIESVPVRCIQVDRWDGLFLAGEALITTHNSTLFRQIAVCVAGGLHPFTGKLIPQQRALYVDCENGPTHMRRKLRPLALQAKLRGAGAGQTLFVEGRPEGLNLMDPAQQQWLVGRVAALQPAVLFTGSLYKLIEGDPNKEEPARAVAAVLDRCRAVANCAIVVEAHSGHAQGQSGERQVRPIGASLWLRWPEFGYGLRPTKDFNEATRVVDFVPWRGDRDERAWPKRLRAGSVWPWTEATYDPYNDAGVAS